MQQTLIVMHARRKSKRRRTGKRPCRTCPPRLPHGETIDMLRAPCSSSPPEIAPRAADIDRGNQFRRTCGARWAISASRITVEETTAHGPWATLAHVGRDGGGEPRLGVGRAVLRRALEPVRQPDPPQRHRGAEAPLLPKLVSGEHVGALAMSEPARARTSCRCASPPCARAAAPTSASCSTAARCGSPTARRRHAGGLRQDRSGAGARHHAFLSRRDEGSARRRTRQAGHARSKPASSCSRTASAAANILAQEGRGVNVLMRARLRARGARRGRWASWRVHGRRGAVRARALAVRPADRRVQLMQGKLADMYTTMNACRAYVTRWRRPATAARPRARTPPARSSTPRRRRRDGGERSRRSAATLHQRLRDRRLWRDAKLYEIAPAPARSADADRARALQRDQVRTTSCRTIRLSLSARHARRWAFPATSRR